MPRKGVTRNGEAYCLECMTEVDPETQRCPSCDFVFDEEVKAFSCPRCRSILVLGTAECAQCGMHFRIKALKQEREVPADADEASEAPERDAMSSDAPAHDEAPERDVGVQRASKEQLDRLEALVANIQSLARQRGELLARMEARLSEEKGRLAEISGGDRDAPRLDIVEAEVVALAEEMEDMVSFHSNMLTIADEISELVDSFDLGEEAEERGLAAKAVKKRLQSMGSSAEELEAREKELSRREEMVDRKIRGYAQKKKDIDDRERAIAAQLERLEEERTRLEGLKADAAAPEARGADWPDREDIALRLARLGAATRDGPEDASVPEGAQMDVLVTGLEESVRELLHSREEMAEKLRASIESEEEVRRLLKILDNLLGQLPEAAIESFTNSEDYALYERVLGRLRI